MCYLIYRNMLIYLYVVLTPFCDIFNAKSIHFTINQKKKNPSTYCHSSKWIILTHTTKEGHIWSRLRSAWVESYALLKKEISHSYIIWSRIMKLLRLKSMINISKMNLEELYTQECHTNNLAMPNLYVCINNINDIS